MCCTSDDMPARCRLLSEVQLICDRMTQSDENVVCVDLQKFLTSMMWGTLTFIVRRGYKCKRNRFRPNMTFSIRGSHREDTFQLGVKILRQLLSKECKGSVPLILRGIWAALMLHCKYLHDYGIVQVCLSLIWYWWSLYITHLKPHTASWRESWAQWLWAQERAN